VTRQLVGEGWLHAALFHYCGSVGPLTLSREVRDRFDNLGKALVNDFFLEGLFGVDCILRDGVPWPVEVNPRYTASVEVLEHAAGVPALALHQKVFERKSPTPAPFAVPPGVVGKAILFAPRARTFPAYGPWTDTLYRPPPVTELPDFADIPAPGEPIQAGWPVLTFFARAATEDACLRTLQQIATSLDRWLFRQ
jgi:predicted ATP-grasp superfamily ATP-dependent carboligase